MKLYFHRAMIYILVRTWPNLFLRYFDDYYKRYTVEFLSKIKGRLSCSYCGYTDYCEREIKCWKCGKGEMIYTEKKK